MARWFALALLLSAVAAYGAINLAGHDPARWHVDPANLTLRGTPNEFLAAVPGTTEATPHLKAMMHPTSPRELLACFDLIVRAHPRVAVVAGDVESLMITYVQRSRIVGFPDYITVRAVAQDPGLPDVGAGLIVYSRSRYGHGDFGVNARRVGALLKESGAIC
ncbi:MAG TPA: DUF1499 domain-containing protein [Thermohalobaculum sp.]|nr:DUF1499 domain-containing protein [Thermohalobaculum sp.]